jgi:hypothetical protein
MRKYESIWLKLKRDGMCTIIADPALHARIKKAVTKEKWSDAGYKVEWDIVGTEQPVLSCCPLKDSNGKETKNSLHFTLIKPIILGDL